MNHNSEPAFAAPWHARAFALAVVQNEAGQFSWSDWTTRFAKTLRRSGLSQSLDGGDDYFLAWLDTLEAMLLEDGKIVKGEIEVVEAELIKALASSPHESSSSQSGVKSD